MSTLEQHLTEYLTMRRALGRILHSLHQPGGVVVLW